MPINTNIFQPLPQARLEVIANAANTLEQGHLKAIEAASKLKEAYASLPLNEAEDGWKAQKISEIQQLVDENSQYGNAYYALDDIIRKTGDIKSDPGLIGRLKAQEEYKKFIDSIDANKNIGADTKEYLKAKNPYTAVTDKYNDKGEVIGTSTWKPSGEIYDDVKWEDLIVKGISLIQPEQSQTTKDTYAYRNANGDIIIKPDYKLEYGELIGTYNTITGQTTKLDKNRLADAVIGMIGLNPNNYGAIDQEIEVGKHFKYDTVYKEDKTTKTRNEYINDKISGLLNAVAYKNEIETEKINAETIKQIGKIKANKNNGGFGDIASLAGSNDISTTTGLNFQVTDNTLMTTKTDSEENGIKIKDTLNDEKSKIKGEAKDSIETNIKNGDYDEALSIISTLESEAEINNKPWFNDLKYKVLQYAVSTGEYNSRKESLTDKQLAESNLVFLMDTKQDLSLEKLGGSKEAEELLNRIAYCYNKAFSVNDKIYYDPYTEEESNNIKKTLVYYNIPFETENGKIVLSKENKNYALDFVNIIKNAEQSVSGVKRYFRNKGFTKINNSYITDPSTGTNTFNIISLDKYISYIQDIYNKANNTTNQIGMTYVAPGSKILGNTLEEQYVNSALAAGVEESNARNAFKEQIKTINDNTERKIRGQYEAMANGGVQVYALDLDIKNPTKPFISLGDPEYEKELEGLKRALQTASKIDCSTTAHITPDGKFIKGADIILTYSNGTKNETKSFSLLLNDYDTDGIDVFRAMNGSPVTALDGKLTGLQYTGNNNAYTNIYNTIMNDKISSINAKYDASSGGYYLTDDGGSVISNLVSKQQIKSFYSFNNTIESLKYQNKMKVFDNNPELYANTVFKTIDDFAIYAKALGINHEWAISYGLALFGINYGRP